MAVAIFDDVGADGCSSLDVLEMVVKAMCVFEDGLEYSFCCRIDCECLGHLYRMSGNLNKEMCCSSTMCVARIVGLDRASGTITLKV